MIIAGTGHRQLDVDYSRLSRRVESTLLEVEPEFVIVGMADGFDLLLGVEALALALPVWAVLPWAGHEFSSYNTNPSDYQFVKENAHKVTILNDSMAKTQPKRAFQNRNEFMVDNATHLLAYWNGSPSGTKNCIDYAKDKIPVRNLYD